MEVTIIEPLAFKSFYDAESEDYGGDYINPCKNGPVFAQPGVIQEMTSVKSLQSHGQHWNGAAVSLKVFLCKLLVVAQL